jgi:hypothetical protein
VCRTPWTSLFNSSEGEPVFAGRAAAFNELALVLSVSSTAYVPCPVREFQLVCQAPWTSVVNYAEGEFDFARRLAEVIKHFSSLLFRL